MCNVAYNKFTLLPAYVFCFVVINCHCAHSPVNAQSMNGSQFGLSTVKLWNFGVELIVTINGANVFCAVNYCMN